MFMWEERSGPPPALEEDDAGLEYKHVEPKKEGLYAWSGEGYTNVR